MVILASIVLALGGIVWWCSGSWAARVVATVLLVPFSAYAVGGIIAFQTAPNQLSPQAVAGIIIGGIGGWFLAGWPQRYWAARVRLEQAIYALTVHPSFRGSTEIIQRDIRT